MNTTGHSIKDTGLWARLELRPELAAAIFALRSNVEVVAEQIRTQLPGFTDHSIRHFDTLWNVADIVISQSEMTEMTPGEAFLLAGSIYLHDLGMAFCATAEGAQKIRETEEYRSHYQRLSTFETDSTKWDQEALRNATRILHAEKAVVLATEVMPGLDRPLIENTTVRQAWGANIGTIAASHHWSISDLKRRLGDKDMVPLPNNERGDLCYVACMLRLIDYAHINSDRARPFERIFREPLAALSKTHWDAQERISGPVRDNDQLSYAASPGLSSVEGWWTFYEMAVGLDSEIDEVRELLGKRPVSVKRFSLEGVKGVRTPQSFSILVPTQGFEPIDIRFRPDSIERIVNLLGGQSLYGNDISAPIRELIQNACDAVHLYRAWAQQEQVPLEEPLISLRITKDDEGETLEVRDNGIGMSQSVVTKYLLGVASNYWQSQDFYDEFSKLPSTQFKPVGKFGIGFLSVFMLGDNVEVTTQRRSGPCVYLKIFGAGGRGTLEKRTASPRAGTIVRIKLRPGVAAKIELENFVHQRASMVDLPISINSSPITTVNPGWWKNLSQSKFLDFVRAGGSIRRMDREFLYLHRSASDVGFYGQSPEVIEENGRILAAPDVGIVRIYSKGFAVTSIPMPGFAGIIDLPNVTLNAARSDILDQDIGAVRSEWLSKLELLIVGAFKSLEGEGSIPSRYKFIAAAAEMYGISLLLRSELRWICVLTPPGDAVLCSPNEVSAKCAAAPSIVLTYGTGIWGAVTKVRELFPETPINALIIPIPTNTAAPGSYDDKEELFEGPLESHFGDRRYGQTDEIPTLLRATLQTIGNLLHVSPPELRFTWRRKDRELVGSLRLNS